VIAVGSLLIAPVFALCTKPFGIDPRISGAILFVVSLITFLVYRSDKLRAERCEWRIPESTLHSLEFMGGWAGGLLAQRLLRHKCSKLSFQVEFWLIVALHQYVALHLVTAGRITRELVRLVS
jgi:uncharacterized membrane protein YsdA (DUF1294 family)